MAGEHTQMTGNPTIRPGLDPSGPDDKAEGGPVSGVAGFVESLSGDRLYVFKTADGETIIDWGGGTARLDQCRADAFAALLADSDGGAEELSEDQPPRPGSVADLIDDAVVPAELVEETQRVVVEWAAFAAEKGYDQAQRYENAITAFLKWQAPLTGPDDHHRGVAGAVGGWMVVGDDPGRAAEMAQMIAAPLALWTALAVAGIVALERKKADSADALGTGTAPVAEWVVLWLRGLAPLFGGPVVAALEGVVRR